jgi:hypothetical protein
MKKIHVFIGIILLIVIAILIWFLFFRTSADIGITVKPTKGKFKVTVTTTGELQATNSIEIRGPAGAQGIGIYQMKISKIVPEGTIVKTGDFVAELDKSDISNIIKDVDISMQKLQSQFLQSRLDSTLNLSAARDEMENIKYSLEEKKLQKEQSKYEPPATIRQVEIDYERTLRSFDQAVKNYATKVQQAVTNLSIVGADLSKEQQKMAQIMNIMNQYTITAPADGMLIYARDWGRRRLVVGSTINSWYPVVAKLPDLTSMESITYVNEIDIQKVKVGQYVNIGLDAMPDKKLTGTVNKVANIGEQLENSDSKVFEVIIKVSDVDTTLRPSMTTSNEIVIATVDNSLYVPLETIHSENNKSFVYKKNNGKIVKQQVQLGLISENEAIIERGIKENDDILLSTPNDLKGIKTVYLK